MRSLIPAAVSQSAMRAGCTETAKRIDVLFEVEAPGVTGNIVFDVGPRTPLRKEGGSMRPLLNFFGHSF